MKILPTRIRWLTWALPVVLIGWLASDRAPEVSVAKSDPALPIAGFRQRPLPVAMENAAHQWTGEDGKNPEIIRRVAHNELEYGRMVEENPRIKRRQLVYRKQPVNALVRQAAEEGIPIRQLVLPGLDGAEHRVQVVDSEFQDGGTRGVFRGILAGRPDSMVTVAFKGEREAFTVISPEDRIYLQAEPREPREIVVKSIDPLTYGANGASCGVQ